MGRDRALSIDVHVTERNTFSPDKQKIVPRRSEGLFEITIGDATSTGGDTDVWRQARQMRQEWRRARYSRLRTL